jgi:hypothetical protein
VAVVKKNEREGFLARKRREAMGRRSSEEEKRDFSLRDPVYKNRAQEKTGSLPE